MKKILVIEDDEMLNAGMCFNVQKEGYEPISVFDLTSAQPYIKNQEIDLNFVINFKFPTINIFIRIVSWFNNTTFFY